MPEARHSGRLPLGEALARTTFTCMEHRGRESCRAASSVPSPGEDARDAFLTEKREGFFGGARRKERIITVCLNIAGGPGASVQRPDVVHIEIR